MLMTGLPGYDESICWPDFAASCRALVSPCLEDGRGPDALSLFLAANGRAFRISKLLGQAILNFQIDLATSQPAPGFIGGAPV